VEERLLRAFGLKEETMKKLIAVALLIIIGSVAAHAQAKQVPDSNCEGLWKYVYSPWRFSRDRRGPKQPNPVCMVFEGTIEEVHSVDRHNDLDGDIDMRLRLDRPFQNKHYLGVEVICAEPQRGNGPAANAARTSCAQFRADGHTNLYPRSQLKKLEGRHVRITGYFVTDYGHDSDPDGNPEIHPVAHITILH
jgi:hypothetical protein